MGNYSFPKVLRILSRSDFVNLNRSGKRLDTKHLRLIIKQNQQGVTRLGVVVSKKTGNAVKRNRIKRLIREFFRLNQSHFPQGSDIVVVAKKDASYLDFQKLKEEIGIISDNKFRV